VRDTNVNATPNLMSVANHYGMPDPNPDGPYGYFEAIRDEAEAAPIVWSEGLGGHWVVGGYEAGSQIVRNSAAFSNKGVTFPSYDLGEFRLIMSMYDDPEHKRQRQFVEPYFTMTACRDYGDWMRETIGELMDRRIGDGRAEVAEWFGEQYPVRLTALLLGVPLEQSERFEPWVEAITNNKNPAATAEAFEEMVGAAQALIERRRVDPSDDVFSHAVNAEIDGDRLKDNELVSLFEVLLLGGIENITVVITTIIRRLAWDDEARRALVADPGLIPTAIDELLRYYAPAIGGRLVTEQVTVGDVTMEPGQHAMLWYPVMNRDRSVFSDPDSLVLDRKPNRHLGFSTSIHRCLGAPLVKIKLKIMLEEFLKRIPEFELDPEDRTEWVTGNVCGARRASIVFAPGEPAGAHIESA
jgi:cytochrome P450